MARLAESPNLRDQQIPRIHGQSLRRPDVLCVRTRTDAEGDKPEPGPKASVPSAHPGERETSGGCQVVYWRRLVSGRGKEAMLC